MSGSFDFQNPRTILIAVASVLLVLGLLIVLFIVLRKRRAAANSQAQADQSSFDREWQFSAAIEQLGYFRNSSDVAREIASLLNDFLSLPVIAIYAGRRGDAQIQNIFSEPESADDENTGRLDLPSSFPAALVGEYQQPRLARIDALLGIEGASTPGSHPDGKARSASLHPAAVSGDNVAMAVILPWHGAFEWSGIVLARTTGPVNGDALSRYAEPVGRLGDRLGVALEIERGRGELTEVSGQALRSAAFYRALISSLDEPAPLTLVASEAARLVQADSAALWRVDDDGAMLRMVGSEGLRVTEFLPLPVGQGLAGTVAKTGETLALEDAPGDPRCLFPREARESGIRSYLGAPVRAGDRVIAVIEVHTSNPRTWNQSDVAALSNAAASIAEVVKSTDARGTRLRVENAYLGLAEAMQRLRSRQDVLDAVVEVLGHALGVSRAVVIEIDQAGAPEPVRHEFRSPSLKQAAGAALTGETLGRVASAVAGGEPMEIADSREQSLLGSLAAAELQVLSELAMPVKVEGKVRSILYLHQCDRFREWKRDEVEFAARVGRQLSLSLMNLTRLDDAARDAAKGAAHIAELERRLVRLDRRLPELEKVMAQTREAEEQARSLLALAKAAETEARGAAEAAARSEGEVRRERDQLREDEARVRRSSQQLLEINRLKSDFITNAGRELEASLQSLIGFVEQLSQGIYGPLTDEQFEALRNIYSWARRLKSDVEQLIDYGSSRARRLETGNEATAGGD